MGMKKYRIQDGYGNILFLIDSAKDSIVISRVNSDAQTYDSDDNETISGINECIFLRELFKARPGEYIPANHFNVTDPYTAVKNIRNALYSQIKPEGRRPQKSSDQFIQSKKGEGYRFRSITDLDESKTIFNGSMTQGKLPESTNYDSESAFHKVGKGSGMPKDQEMEDSVPAANEVSNRLYGHISFGLPMRNEYFTGRDDLLLGLRDAFSKGAHIQILRGLGGIGKTTAALEFAYKYKQEYDLVHFVEGDTVDKIIASYRSILEVYGNAPVRESRIAICQQYKDLLSKYLSCLIIYDNCDFYSEEELDLFKNSCLPQGNENIIITSRDMKKIGKNPSIDLDGFNTDESVDFILARTELEDTPQNRKDAEMLADLVKIVWPEHTEEALTRILREYMSSDESAVFTEKRDEEYIGAALCCLRHDYVEGCETSPVGYLEGIYIEEKYRKMGYAKELLAMCEKWAKEKGCSEFASDCELINEASYEFHMKVGFTEANRIICFTKQL